MDWATFWNATIAAATVATAISTTTVLLLQRRNRPEADWAVWLNQPQEPSSEEPRPGVRGKITNAGDGDAFRVTVTGEHCDAKLLTRVRASFAGVEMAGRVRLPFQPLLEPGAEAEMGVRCAVDDWDRAVVVVSWTRSPTRLRKRVVRRLPLREHAEPPPPE